jgi:hypothetical protein
MVDNLVQSEISSLPSASETKTISTESFDPHSTKWSDVNLFKFGALITVSSTIENAIFYPSVFYFSSELVLFDSFLKNRLYVIKTREQSDRRNLTLLQSFRYHLKASLSKSTNITQTSSLYRGFWFSNIASFPSYGLYLGVYIASKDQLNASPNRSARFYAPFIAGALGKSNNLSWKL